MEDGFDMKVGVSRCLLGVACRYDGRSKPCAMVRDTLARMVELVPICPECDCGLSCPRTAMDLYCEDGDSEIRMTDRNGVEHGLQMRAWIGKILPELADLQGFVLKARSPSCGLGDAKLNGGPTCTDGLFAGALRQRYPQMVLRNEEAFATEDDCVAFVRELREQALIGRVETCVRELLANSPACHDWDHTLRVWNNAKRIAAMTKSAQPGVALDETLVSVAALMHDIGRPQELADQGKTNHASYGADMSLKLLPELGVTDERFCANVADCIRSHRFRKREGNAEPSSLEARIVYDADKLDSIGAIGIGRSFHFAGRTGARVHNRKEEALSSESYSREDSAYREYLVKLRKIRERMLTDAGRQLAERRHEFMTAFFAELNAECGFTDQSECD